MAEWIDLGGTSGWYYYPTRPLSGWVTRRRTDEAVAYHRYGDPTQLRKLGGKVVRGYSIVAAQSSLPRNNVMLAAWPYLVYPQPQLSWHEADGNTSTQRSAVFEDTGTPIGRFPSTPDNFEVNSDDWLGLFSTGPVQNRTDGPSGPDARFFFTFYRFAPAPREFKVLIDDPPRWEVIVASAVPRTDVVPFDVRLFWPDDTPVPGLSVRVTVGVFTSIRALGGVFSLVSAAATTDADGIARFELRGDHVGVETLQVNLDSADAWRAGYFEPELPTTVAVAVNGIEGDDPETGCYVVPAQSAIPSAPSRVEILPWFEWNAGANSVASHEGDARVVFTMVPAVGVVLGFAPDRDDPTNMLRVTHGFSFTKSANDDARAQIIEAGVTKGGVHTYDDETEFQVRRVSGVVTYWIDGEMIYVSRTPSVGEIIVGTALYASGDAAPDGPGAAPPPPPDPEDPEDPEDPVGPGDPGDVELGWNDLLSIADWFNSMGGAPVTTPVDVVFPAETSGFLSVFPELNIGRNYAVDRVRITAKATFYTSVVLSPVNARIENERIDFTLNGLEHDLVGEFVLSAPVAQPNTLNVQGFAAPYERPVRIEISQFDVHVIALPAEWVDAFAVGQEVCRTDTWDYITLPDSTTFSDPAGGFYLEVPGANRRTTSKFRVEASVTFATAPPGDSPVVLVLGNDEAPLMPSGTGATRTWSGEYTLGSPIPGPTYFGLFGANWDPVPTEYLPMTITWTVFEIFYDGAAP